MFLGPAGNVNVNLRRTDRDAKNARNESRNEMNASVEFAAGRSERVASSRSFSHIHGDDLTGHVPPMGDCTCLQRIDSDQCDNCVSYIHVVC